MLLSQERVRLKITQWKIALMVHRVNTMIASREVVKLKITQSERYPGYNSIIPGKSKTRNPPVKSSIKSTQGTMLFS